MTFNNIAELEAYVDQVIVENHNNEITGPQMNDILTGVIKFIQQSPRNFNKAYRTATAGSFVATEEQCVLIFDSGATGSIQLCDTRWNEWVIFNRSGSQKQLVGSIAAYRTLSGVQKNYVADGETVTIAKASNNFWYEISTKGGSNSEYGCLVDTIATQSGSYENPNITDADSIPYLILNKQIYTEIDGDYTVAAPVINFADITLNPDDTIIIPLKKLL
jgi:hypothetical protein